MRQDYPIGGEIAIKLINQTSVGSFIFFFVSCPGQRGSRWFLTWRWILLSAPHHSLLLLQVMQKVGGGLGCFLKSVHKAALMYFCAFAENFGVLYVSLKWSWAEVKKFYECKPKSQSPFSQVSLEKEPMKNKLNTMSQRHSATTNAFICISICICTYLYA